MSENNFNLPKHIAFIMDGNRRWAKAKGLQSFSGHFEGAKTLERFIDNTGKLQDIPYITFWGGSVNNLTVRPKLEIKALFDVYEEWFTKLLKRKELIEEDIRVRIIGNWTGLAPASLQKVFTELSNKTKDHKRRNLTFLIAYSGKEEIVEAIKKISNLKSSSSEINEVLIEKSLWTGDLPPVDLVIRTGIDKNDAPHWSSGFMMWLCANSQFYFTKTLWPDFSEKELEKALGIYTSSQRRFGK